MLLVYTDLKGFEVQVQQTIRQVKRLNDVPVFDESNHDISASILTVNFRSFLISQNGPFWQKISSLERHSKQLSICLRLIGMTGRKCKSRF